jgi:hypothetical protein
MLNQTPSPSASENSTALLAKYKNAFYFSKKNRYVVTFRGSVGSKRSIRYILPLI